MTKSSLTPGIYRPIREWVNDTIVRCSLIEDRPVHDPRSFPWTQTLEASWRAIRGEAGAVWRHREAIPSFVDVLPQAYKISTDDAWKTFFLYCYGERIDANCARAPETTRLVEQIPGLSMALFSFHEPRLHIPAHVGVTKFFLTCHLGLWVPQDWRQCRFRVGHQLLHWREGQTIVFDDMTNHEVWNDTDEYRAILMLQFARPVTWWGRVVGNAFRLAIRYSPIGTEVRDRLEAWDGRYQQAADAVSQAGGMAPR